jgi:hypothetical protein
VQRGLLEGLPAQRAWDAGAGAPDRGHCRHP